MATILVPGVDPDIDADIRKRWGLKPGDPVPLSLNSPTFAKMATERRAGPMSATVRSKRVATHADKNGPGDKAARLSDAMGYSKIAHDLFGALAETGGGRMAKRVFAPLGYALDSVGAISRLRSSLQRGEPGDVAIARAAAPVIGSAIGGVGGTAVGALGGGIVGGSMVPVIGAGPGVVGGGIVGGIAGSYTGGELGEEGAETYARMRRSR